MTVGEDKMDLIMYILMDSSHYSSKPKCTSLKHFHEHYGHFPIFSGPCGCLSPTMTQTKSPQLVNVMVWPLLFPPPLPFFHLSPTPSNSIHLPSTSFHPNSKAYSFNHPM